MAAVKTRNTATLMTEGSIVKSLLLFALPLIFGNLLQQMYNTADSIIVGNFVGSNALAAVGSSGSPIYLLIGFSQGLAVGAGVVVSQYLGAGDHKETHEAVHTALAFADRGRRCLRARFAGSHEYPRRGAGRRCDLYPHLLWRGAVQRGV